MRFYVNGQEINLEPGEAIEVEMNFKKSRLPRKMKKKIKKSMGVSDALIRQIMNYKK